MQRAPKSSDRDLRQVWLIAVILLVTGLPRLAAAHEPRFEGKFFSGSGDVDYLRLLDFSRRLFAPDPQFQNLAMLYTTNWNGLVEGPTWNAWWIQNSYGTTYAALPFCQEPFVTFLQNAQDLWFDQMGDGKRVGAPPPMDWVAPDGALCDAARPGWIVYRQGDGRIQIHDWALEFTAAGVVMQAELLLISRDPAAIARYLPRLERCARFIESRRHPANNLFLAGPAGNLLAPSYAGWKRSDGTYGKAYLTGLSITYIAALDRLIELEKMAGRTAQADLYTRCRATAREGLARVTTDEGYFIRSLDPDGVKHGVYGAPVHGYFETSPNQDAIAFRVVDDAQAERIYQKIASIPGLRPYDFILPNYPSYDDMYEKPEGLWAFGTWVNGGHWSTCEARMILGYYRLSHFEDARRSLRRLHGFAERFRMDNPLVKFGSAVYQPNEPINLCYDTFGPAAAFIRGLFEYQYRADGLTLVPHIPPSITELEQRFPIRFGKKRLYLATVGTGPVTGVRINHRRWDRYDKQSVFLPYAATPDTARIEILLGNAAPKRVRWPMPSHRPPRLRFHRPPPSTLADLPAAAARLKAFYHRLEAAGLDDGYEAAHARLALEAIATVLDRRRLLQAGRLAPLPGPTEAAADQAYHSTAVNLCVGLDQTIGTYELSNDPRQRAVFRMWWQTVAPDLP
ncbi:MAG: hypothetical protein KGS61_07615 [Verrucomicrobia bacterium]|nr:hypothetical protein [Verrucomicrobiota bacterium]